MEFTLGAFCFGLVVGWITYRTLRRNAAAVGISDLASVIGAIGGAAVTSLFEGNLFESYAVGLAVGFFAYLVVSLTIYGKDSVGGWMGTDNPSGGP